MVFPPLLLAVVDSLLLSEGQGSHLLLLLHLLGCLSLLGLLDLPPLHLDTMDQSSTELIFGVRYDPLCGAPC